MSKRREIEPIESIVDGLATIPPTERAWVAGFFDGEGSFYASMRGSTKNASIIMQITQSDLYTLKRAQRALGGGGNIREVKPGPKHTKKHYALTLCSKRDVFRAIYCALPYLSLPKLQQLEKVWNRVKDSKSDGLTVLWPTVKI